LIIQRQNFRRENLTKKFLIAGFWPVCVRDNCFQKRFVKTKIGKRKKIRGGKRITITKLENERSIADMEMLALLHK
jgi:hypothetical protein